MRISDWSSDVFSSDLIEIVEDGEMLQPVGWLDQQRGAEAVAVLVLEIAAAAEILDLSVSAVDPAGDAQPDIDVHDSHVERALPSFRVKDSVARPQVSIEPLARLDRIQEHGATQRVSAQQHSPWPLQNSKHSQ